MYHYYSVRFRQACFFCTILLSKNVTNRQNVWMLKIIMVLFPFILRDSVCLSLRSPHSFRRYKVNYKLGRLQQISPTREDDNNSVDRVKRKVALVCSYVGSDYFGLQDMEAQNADGTARNLPTVESELKRALLLSELVTESNSKELGKISWSRSSRTDKGVHAARIVITAKLELKRHWVDGNVTADETGFIRLPQVPEIMNKHLPPQVRVFSCVKVNGGFQAREACSWRSYEYILPLELLSEADNMCPDHQKDPAVIKAFALLQQCLKKFEGGYISFHNFHRMKGKALFDTRGRYLREKMAESKKQDQNTAGNRFKGSQRQDEDEEEEEEVDEGIEEPEGENVVSEGSQRPKRDFTNVNMYENWTENPRIVTARCFGTVFYCKAQLCDGTGEMRQFVRVQIGGQSFMMHQIRLMVGAALLVARGILPLTAVDFALAAPIQLVLPLAPAEGLTLMYSGYLRNINGQAFSLTRDTAGHDTDLILMSEDEAKECEEFYEHAISTKVVGDWLANDHRLIKDWSALSRRYRASEDLVRRWEEILAVCSSNAAAEEVQKLDRERIRIVKLIQKFQGKYLPSIQKVNSSLFEPDGFVESKRTVLPMDQDIWPFKLFLPNCMSTDLVRRFGVMPGKQVSEALRALVTQIILEEIPPACSSPQLLHYMIHGKLPADNEESQENESPQHLRDRLHFWANTQPKFRMIKWS